MADQKLGSLYYTVGIQGMQSFLKDSNALRKQIVDLANTPIKSLLSAIDVPDVAQMQRTLNANRTNTINALRTALGSGTLNRKETDVASRALDFVKADSAATIGLFKALQDQRRAFSEKIGRSAEELKSIKTMISAGEASGEVSKGSMFANNLRAAAAHATIIASSMDGVNRAITNSDAALAKSYNTYERSSKTSADLERLAAATAKHKVAESLTIEKAEFKESQRIAKAKQSNAAYGEHEFEKMAAAETASSAPKLLEDARRRTRQYVNEQLKAGNVYVETDPAVIRARASNATNAEATYRSNRVDDLLTGSRSRLAGAEQAYEAGPKTLSAQMDLNAEAMRYSIEERRTKERVAGERRLEEHALESSMPQSSAELRVRAKLADLEEVQLHTAQARADMEQRVNNTLGTQVSYTEKIAAAEQDALKYARERASLSGTALTPEQEEAIKKGTRSAEEANLVGGVAGDAQKGLQDAEEKLRKLKEARKGATAENAPIIDKAIRDTQALIAIEKDRLRIARELAAIENRKAQGGLSKQDKRELDKAEAYYKEELKKKNAESANAGRHNAKDSSKLFNYRLQELSYGVQDFAQVLSGGGGLDAALRAANNNISQFFAAAGGANAARNSMVATFAVLGIAGAMKFLADQTDLPIKKLEEFNERLKKLQSSKNEIAKVAESGLTRLGDISGEAGLGVGRTMSDLGLGIRDKQDLLGNEVDIFGGRRKISFGGFGPMERTKVAGAAVLGGMSSLAGLLNSTAGDYFKSGENELYGAVSSSVLGQAFNDRFSEKKDVSEIRLPATMPAAHRKYFQAILGSKDTSAESAIKAFKQIDEGGGWADLSKEELEPFRESIRQLEQQMKMLAAASKAFENSLVAMDSNLKQRNALLATSGSQSRLRAASEDVRFINEQTSLATQQENDAKALRSEGLVKQAERAEKEAAARRRVIAVRMANMAPGGGAMLTNQAASFEDALAPFAEARAAAKKMLAEAQTPTGRAGALTQIHNIGLNEADTLRRESMGFTFSSQRANESFAEADAELSKTYQQMVKSIEARAGDNKNAADAAKAKLGEAKKREDERRASDRQFEKESRYERAYGTSFDEQKAAIEKSRREELAKINQDYADDEDKRRDQVFAANSGYDRRVREVEKMKGRAEWGAMTMFSGQAASMIGGREGQHFSNAKQLEDNLNAIQDAVDAGLFGGREGDIEKKRQEAQTLFNERQKEIEQKQVGFSDIGGMWKQIQMSLKPDKSLEIQKIANDHLGKIKDMAEGAGLKVQIPLGA